MLIGLYGPAGVGKSTLAKAIQEEHSLTHIESFAKPIKQMTIAMTGQDNPLDKNAELPGIPGVTYRHAWQTLGTEWGRDHIHEDIWVWLLVHRLHNAGRHLTPEAPPIVIDDVRFANEAEWIQSHNGIVIKLRRLSNDFPYVPPHRSERSYLSCDHILECSNTEETVKKVLELAL